MRRIKKMQDDIQSLFYQVNEKISSEDITECEICGCLVFKDKENRGEPRVVEKKIYIPLYGFKTTDKIHYPYYCKLHMPKSLKEKKKEK